MLIDRVEHHNINNNGHNIHYVTVGDDGPQLLFVHGWPDFWYLWHNQLEALCGNYQCAAMDLRGTNLSGAAEGPENQAMELYLSDIDAVIRDFGAESVTLIAHDAGGLVAWYYAMEGKQRSKLNGLVQMNINHPRGFTRALEIATPELAQYTDYARIFMDSEQYEKSMQMLEAFLASRLNTIWKDASPREIELVNEANARTNLASLADFYKANYWEPPYKEQTDFPLIGVPVLQFHGLADMAVYKDGLADTWDMVDNEYTLVTYPGVGHIPHKEVPERVNAALKAWLNSK